ncbi:uncharacterized protein LOC133836374 isoform X4 [Drosophila sulfurigaster albostrigata]|uniref:uncharacterized protein LOC133836374 isoform X4 n=1 Tax=Drosophila sulfurigaster albostrigata TaxID=89887 RepID=UPI002D21C911|nr:uncharacterized protein LOC133836374 isoform X4 [Drosophila sulfurigaster albostrigata]
MKTENLFKYGAPLYNLKSTRAHSQSKPQSVGNANLTSLLTTGNLQTLTQNRGSGYSDRESICSVSSAAGRVKRRSRNFSMKSSKGISKKSKTMDYTNYAYNEAVGRLKVMLADNSYVATPKVVGSASYLRNFNEDSGDNFSDNLSVIERPVFSDISKYLSPSQKSRMSTYRPKKSYTAGYLSASKENLASAPSTFPSNVPVTTMPTDSVQAPVEIFNFIEKQEDYIEQLEKESKYCRNELTNLLGKVKDVINENENLTENARSELAALGSGTAKPLAQQVPITTTSPSSDSDEHLIYAGRKTPSTPRKATLKVQPPRYASAPNIVYEARISELEAELMQANIDLKRVKTENDELKRKIAHTDPLSAVATLGSVNCDTHRKQLELLQQDKSTLEESVRQLQRMLDDAKSQHHNSASSKRYISDLVQMERSQAELAYGELKNEIRPTKKDLDKRISEMQDKHAETVNELEEMITSQKQLMDKLTNECKTLTGKLEDTTYKHNEEKLQLRDTNEQLMARLRQIWSKYKTQIFNNGNSVNEVSSEEATANDDLIFSPIVHNLEMLQPHTITSRPHMAQQLNPYKAPHNYTTTLTTTTSPAAPTVTKPQRRHRKQLLQYQQHQQHQHQISSESPAIPTATQLVDQLQQRARAASAMVTPISCPTAATVIDSTITMTKISKTTLAWGKSSSSSCNRSWSNNVNDNANVNVRNEIESYNNCVSSERNVNGSVSVSKQSSSSSKLSTTDATAMPLSSNPCSNPKINNNNHNNHSSSSSSNLAMPASPMPAVPTWPPTTPTIVPTISSSTMPVHTILAHMHSSHTMPSSMATMPTRPMTTAGPTMPRLDINMMRPQKQPQPLPTQHSRRLSSRDSISQQREAGRITGDPRRRRRCRQMPHPQRQLQHQQQLRQQQSPVPERAAHNRARAAELWGQQLHLEHSAAADPLCHNSLPRQPPPRSSWSPESTDLTPIDPLQLEFSISSPSLMRSSDTSNPEEDSFVDLSETFVLNSGDSDVSLSPAHTTIITVRRSSAPAVVQPINESSTTLTTQEPQKEEKDHTDTPNETMTIERDYRAM